MHISYMYIYILTVQVSWKKPPDPQRRVSDSGCRGLGLHVVKLWARHRAVFVTCLAQHNYSGPNEIKSFNSHVPSSMLVQAGFETRKTKQAWHGPER